jgi:hypothetical protein
MSPAKSGKWETTVSSRSSRPSACANAAAVEVKLLLSEYSNCGRPALYGAHHPSATTCPCRTTIRLCISMSGRSSTASRKLRIAAGSTRWSAGVLRGRELGMTRA